MISFIEVIVFWFLSTARMSSSSSILLRVDPNGVIVVRKVERNIFGIF